jgi:F-type H+-transporting ATPase subunit b
MDPKGLAFLGAGLGAGLALIGAGMGIGRLAASAMDGIARQPQAAGTIQTAMLIAAGAHRGRRPVRSRHLLPAFRQVRERLMAGRLLAWWLVVMSGIATVGASEGAPEGTADAASNAGNALITPHIGLMFWTLVTFLVLLYVLSKFAWGPIIRAMNAREEGIKTDLDNARKEREDAQRLLQEHRALLDQARRERADAVEAGRRDAERLKSEILEEARRQREQLMAQADTQIAAGLRHAKSELKGAAADLAIQVAGKLMGKNLDDATQRRLVDDYLADLERLGSRSETPPH